MNESIVLGGGCFWCIEAVYRRIDGVVASVPGYAGGKTENPTYEQVCSGSTGHAEVVRVEFDPGIVTLDEILEIYWKAHDPTTKDRQGNDIGSQYRSIILYGDEAQKMAAEKSLADLDASGSYGRPAVTEIVPLGKFWTAEAYHKDYFETHRNAGYCRVVISPKLKKLALSED